MPSALLLVAWLFLAAAPSVAEAADIVIAQIVDESGDGLEQSRDYVAGARVYFDWINSQGGITGRRLVLITRADGTMPPAPAMRCATSWTTAMRWPCSES